MDIPVVDWFRLPRAKLAETPQAVGDARQPTLGSPTATQSTGGASSTSVGVHTCVDGRAAALPAMVPREVPPLVRARPLTFKVLR